MTQGSPSAIFSRLWMIRLTFQGLAKHSIIKLIFVSFQLSSLELICRQNEEVIKKREVAIKELQSELDRQAQIAAMIHNLSSGKVPISYAGNSS